MIMEKNYEREGKILGEKLYDGLLDGTFKKYHLPNHGENFTGDLEILARWKFNKYIGSCTYLLLNNSLNKKGCVYRG